MAGPGYKGKYASKKIKLPRAAKVVAIILATVGLLYSLFAFSHIPFIQKARYAYIETAMSTMRHQWLATAFFPKSVVSEVMDTVEQARKEQIGIESDWDNIEKPKEYGKDGMSKNPTQKEIDFYTLFHEIDPYTMTDYLDAHPAALDRGWKGIYINEAGLEDNGTSIRTRQGDEVLAVDAENGVILIRVSSTGFRGVLAIGKDPSKLSVCMAESLGESGEHLATIAKKNGGVLGITANGFEDYNAEGESGKGNGGILTGYTMSHGVSYGEHMQLGYKRLELRSDDRMYIVDSISPVHEDCTDASEFTPALIVDGKILVDEYCGWNAINPRACIGQSNRGEIMMLVIEGRLSTSLGIGVVKCAEMMHDYGCVQAMNLDGGTSAIMWYRGEYVTRCSNTLLPYGRPLPNAYIYEGTM